MWGGCACAIPRAQVPAHLKTRIPLWSGPTTFVIMIAEVLPSVSNCLSRSLFRITVRSAVAGSCFSGAVFPPRKRREFTQARRRSETQGPCPMGLTYAP